jgi:nicotinate dehydrogenase subunit A
MATDVAMTVNGRARTVRVEDPQTPLLYVLRNQFELNGPKYGCGLGQCGACTVLVDGQAVRSCSLPAPQAAGKTIVTLEGLGTPEQPHPIQKAFIAEQAVQCGYCINGMIMQSAAFLAANRAPTEEQIREALKDNLCRCGTHVRIVAAVQRAAAEIGRG